MLAFFLLSCSVDKTGKQRAPDATFSKASVDSGKIKGVSLVGSSAPIDATEFKKLDSLHVNFVCLLPFAFVQQGKTKVYYDEDFQWWGERPAGIAACIKLAHTENMQVMIKPQLWLSDGKFTGELSFESPEDWLQFENEYSSYIFRLLRIADSLQVAYFCLGTELSNFAHVRKNYWENLLDSARKIFSGKLTYAENWDTYREFPYWDKLDVMGINAYFPLSDSITPPIDELLQQWEPHYRQMKDFSALKQKPILFTEYGYRSIDYATSKPWESYSSGKTNLLGQQNAYEALFQKFWNEPWIAGGFFWKWFDAHTPPDVPLHLDFTPQNKPALQVIQQWYGQ